MRKKLHPAVLTVGILQVLFGVLVLACDGFGVVNAGGLFLINAAQPPATKPPAQSGPGTKGQPQDPGAAFGKGLAAGLEANQAMLQNAPSYKYVELAKNVFGLLLAVVMITSGIGLFFMQSWARWLAVGYGVVSILGRCTCVGYHAGVILPILLDLGQEFVRRGDADMESGLWGIKYGPFFGLLLGLYPLLVIILLLLPQVGRAFRAAPVPEDGFADYRDRDDYRDRFRGGDYDRYAER